MFRNVKVQGCMAAAVCIVAGTGYLPAHAQKARRLFPSLSTWGPSSYVAAGPQERDYLSEEEADKIREARVPDAKVKLFLNFAADRLKKFQYEQERTSPEYRKDETLNGLLNAYSGCIDDAADIISLSMEKQEDIRLGIKEMQTRAKGFLVTLKNLEAKGANLDSYKETLDDAIEGTQDALQDIQNDLKEMTPPPTRRPQS